MDDPGGHEHRNYNEESHQIQLIQLLVLGG